jgi:Fe-Mn family superoxide dismutase
MYKKQWTRKEILKALTAPVLLSVSSPLSLITDDISIQSFQQKPLPYAPDALEPYIDVQTMQIHYGKHASAYCNNLNEALKKSTIPAGTDMETILARVSEYSVSVRNNAGGHYNHELFWSFMIPGGTDLKETNFKSIFLETFGSLQNFQQAFSDLALNRFGSGWAWLYIDNKNQLKIGSTPNQDNPLMDVSSEKGYPLLCLDVWEHAYYLKYQNKRAEYVRQWWNIVNWDAVSDRFNNIMK